ncbi:hypothetical protein NMY22_g298 [Coprinellus aureogranulatus]|nr:hypothetical protein NMY22_g298 [Coprinellus aureogranulatus]
MYPTLSLSLSTRDGEAHDFPVEAESEFQEGPGCLRLTRINSLGSEIGALSLSQKTPRSPQHLLPQLYRSLVLTVRTMFHVCKLVHADLSEYNILYHTPSSATDSASTSTTAVDASQDIRESAPSENAPTGELWIIDVSQSVEHDHPSAFDFLRNDVKNVEDFFARKGVSTLGLRRTFEFVTREKVTQPRHDGGQEESDEEALDRWISERESQGADADGEEANEGKVGELAEEEKRVKDEEHEDAIFMKSYIPRNLNEVYDPERDVEKVARGEAKNLIYADTIGVVAPAGASEGTSETKGGVKVEDEGHAESEGDNSESEGDEGSEDEEGEEGEKGFVEKKPRGHKFEDKEAKKERKKAAKEEAREKRKNKMPKAEKKKLMKKSARSG